MLHFFKFQFSVDLDELSMASAAAALSSIVNHNHEWDVVENVILLSKFGLSHTDFSTFLLSSLPARSTLNPNKLWSIVQCKCNEIRGFHYTVKQCNKSENIVTIDFQNPTVCITPNTDSDRRILTHIFILVLRNRESYWTNISKSSTAKLHDIAAKLICFIEPQLEVLSDSEKENSPIKLASKRLRRLYDDNELVAKKPKVVAPKQRNYVTLCKTGMIRYNQEKKELTDYLATLPFEVDIKFAENDGVQLAQKVGDLLRKKNEQEMQDIVEGKTGSMTGELEALFRSFQSLKGTAVANIGKCMTEAKKLKAARDEEIERQKIREEQEMAKQRLEEIERQKIREEQEMSKRRIEEIKKQEAEEQELIKVAALADNLSCTIPKATEPQYEDGEITELERVQAYYSRAIQVAAQYALCCERFMPCMKPIDSYSADSIMAMRAQSRNAMNACDDVLLGRRRPETSGQWYGPCMPNIPADLPDLYNEMERLKNLSNIEYKL